MARRRLRRPQRIKRAKPKRRRTQRRWIQKAVNPKHKGLLHRELGVPKGKKIPLAKLRRAARMEGAIGRRARFALNMRRVQTRRKRRRRK